MSYLLTDFGVDLVEKRKSQQEKVENKGIAFNSSQIEVKLGGVSHRNYLSAMKGCAMSKLTFDGFITWFGEDTFIEGIHYNIVGRKKHNRTLHNLEDPLNCFIGREVELRTLAQLFSKSHHSIVTIKGIGGVGKSALSNEYGRRHHEPNAGLYPEVNEDNTYEVVVFVSAKENILKASGINNLASDIADNFLENLLLEIARTIGDRQITQAKDEQKEAIAYRVLANYKTLLIVDNFETIKDKSGTLKFLQDLPKSTNVLITTRSHNSDSVGINEIFLGGLPQKSGIQFINQLIEAKVNQGHTDLSNLTDKDKTKIYDRFKGVPLAIEFIIGRLAYGTHLDYLLSNKKFPRDLALFVFEDSLKELDLENNLAIRVLMLIVVFPDSPSVNAIRDIILNLENQDPDRVSNAELNDALDDLETNSFIRIKDGYCNILPMTREYAIEQLSKSTHVELKNSFLAGYIDWYKDFVVSYGGKDGSNWIKNYEQLDEHWNNIRTAVNHCLERKDFTTFYKFIEKLCHFTSIYGYWYLRCKWLDLLIKQAQGLDDVCTVVWALVEKYYILIKKGEGKSDDAMLVFGKISLLIDQLNDPLININQVDVIDTKISFHFNCALANLSSDPRSSLDHLSCSQKLISGFCDDGALDGLRRLTSLNDIQAQAYCKLSKLETDQNSQHRQQAEKLLKTVIKNTATINWPRKSMDARYQLIKFKLEDDDSYIAQPKIFDLLSTAEEAGYTYMMAECYGLLATLAFRNNLDSSYVTDSEDNLEILQFINNAEDGYERLGMLPQILNMTELRHKITEKVRQINS